MGRRFTDDACLRVTDRARSFVAVDEPRGDESRARHITAIDPVHSAELLAFLFIMLIDIQPKEVTSVPKRDRLLATANGPKGFVL